MLDNASTLNKYTAIIVDDEPILRHSLDQLLSELWPELEIVGHGANGKEALKLVDEQTPDLLFLDIRMPGIDGISLAKKIALQAQSPLVIFTTAYDQYAVQAFESEAVDYILKPINEARLLKTIKMVKRRLSERASVPTLDADIETIFRRLKQLNSLGTPEYLTWIKASQKDNIHLLATKDILYFQAEDKYTSVFTQDGEYLIRTSIKTLITQLNPQYFWQIHRGTVVCVDQIDKVKRNLSGRMFVYLKGTKIKLAVSRGFQRLFKQM